MILSKIREIALIFIKIFKKYHLKSTYLFDIFWIDKTRFIAKFLFRGERQSIGVELRWKDHSGKLLTTWLKILSKRVKIFKNMKL